MENLNERFEQLRKQLTELCFQGQYHYRTYKRLRTLLYEKTSYTRIAEVFFGMTVPAHFYTGIGYLCQLYDRNDQTISIFRYIKFVKSNLQLFTKIEKETLIYSIHKTYRELEAHNTIINNLRTLRNKYYFHLDFKYLDDPLKVFEEYPVTYNEIEKLFDLAGQIINQFSIYYNECETKMAISREEDIFDLFNFLEESIEKRREEFENKYGIRKGNV